VARRRDLVCAAQPRLRGEDAAAPDSRAAIRPSSHAAAVNRRPTRPRSRRTASCGRTPTTSSPSLEPSGAPSEKEIVRRTAAHARLDTPHADPSRSAADAWIFASLSLDGKVVVNHVPPSEKYKILL